MERFNTIKNMMYFHISVIDLNSKGLEYNWVMRFIAEISRDILNKIFLYSNNIPGLLRSYL